MLFNSYEFVLLFCPIAFVLFWYGGKSLTWRLGLLTFASYAFYSWWQFNTWGEFKASLRVWDAGGPARFFHAWRFTLVMLASSSVDYFAAAALAKLARVPDTAPPEAGDAGNVLNYGTPRPASHEVVRWVLLALSLTANLGLLAYFKYAGFFSQIASDLSHALHGPGLSIIRVILPVGISFYTFESMSYVIDVYRNKAKPAKSYLDYACFISFFPHLVAGPIIRYSDILHQFRDTAWRRPNPDWSHVSVGLVLFTMGMAKKLLLADPLATLINPLWDALGHGAHLGMKGSWAAVLGYTFRIYFDFSGYSDMAVGLGHLFAVRLPQNFDSPYKAANPSDFWRRWHMTLSLWLRDYLYIPLGGSRTHRTVRNLLITMLLGGLWHGAAWLFVIWGLWHGLMLAGWHGVSDRKPKPPRVAVTPVEPGVLEYHSGVPEPRPSIDWRQVRVNWTGRVITFLLVVVGWTFFRAADVRQGNYGWSSVTPAIDMLKQMFVPSLTPLHRHEVKIGVEPMLAWRIAFAWAWCNFLPNSFQIAYGLKLRKRHAIVAGALMALCVLYFGVHMDFLYFRF